MIYLLQFTDKTVTGQVTVIVKIICDFYRFIFQFSTIFCWLLKSEYLQFTEAPQYCLIMFPKCQKHHIVTQAADSYQAVSPLIEIDCDSSTFDQTDFSYFTI